MSDREFVALHTAKCRWELVGDRHALPSEFYALALDREPWCALTMVADRGRVRCVELFVMPSTQAPMITSTLLRNVPVDGYVKRARDLLAVEFRRSEDGSLQFSRSLFGGSEALERFVAAYQRSARPRRGVRLSDHLLRQVADVYRDALAAQESPTKTVMLRLHASRARRPLGLRSA